MAPYIGAREAQSLILAFSAPCSHLDATSGRAMIAYGLEGRLEVAISGHDDADVVGALEREPHEVRRQSDVNTLLLTSPLLIPEHSLDHLGSV